jgi:hypothetical protein
MYKGRKAVLVLFNPLVARGHGYAATFAKSPLRDKFHLLLAPFYGLSIYP